MKRTVCIGIVSILVVGATTLIGVPALAAPGVKSAVSVEPIAMGSFRVADYESAAAALPAQLSSAVRRDLHLSAAEYLEQSAASLRAVSVVASLSAGGVGVLGSRIDGTVLTVNVKTAGDAAQVVLRGARAELGSPRSPKLPDMVFSPVDSLYDGTGIFWTTAAGSSYQCSVGFNGFQISNGTSQLATAGHCVAGMDPNNSVYALVQSAPQSGGSRGSLVGAAVAGSAHFGSGQDVGLVSVTGMTPVAAAATWNGGSGAATSSAPLPITGDSAAIVNANLCKSGSRTGWTCGTVKYVDQPVSTSNGSSTSQVNSIVASICVLPGDSGGSAMIGGSAVGITSGTSDSSACNSSSYGTFFPMISSNGSADVTSTYQGTWEPSITVATPAVSSSTGSTTQSAGTLSGTLATPSASSTVRLYVDGSSKVAATASASSGSWTLTFPLLSAGSHSYSVIASWGTWSRSLPTTGNTTVTTQSSPSAAAPSSAAPSSQQPSAQRSATPAPSTAPAPSPSTAPTTDPTPAPSQSSSPTTVGVGRTVTISF